jgi:hypothetical protein
MNAVDDPLYYDIDAVAWRAVQEVVYLDWIAEKQFCFRITNIREQIEHECFIDEYGR